MRIMTVGGTGLLGYHAILAALERGHSIGALAIEDVELGSWYPTQVSPSFGDVFTLTQQELTACFAGYDALIYAVGPDDRVVPPAPAYAFFHTRLVENCEKTVIAARNAGVKRCVILNSYFAYFDRLWPEKKLALRHPYIRCRIEQAQRAIAAGEGGMDVMILELPYIFGSMPGRTPIWKNVFLDRFSKGRVIYFPKGGTAMISAGHVGEAVIGALENGKHGVRYPVGDENHTFKEMFEMFLEAQGEHKKVISIPRFIAELAGMFMIWQHRIHGLESGLNIRYLMRDIMSDYCYIDVEETAKILGYGRGGLNEAITDTIRACRTKTE